MAQYPATGVPSTRGTTNVQAPPGRSCAAAMALGGRQRFLHGARVTRCQLKVDLTFRSGFFDGLNLVI